MQAIIALKKKTVFFNISIVETCESLSRHENWILSRWKALISMEISMDVFNSSRFRGTDINIQKSLGCQSIPRCTKLSVRGASHALQILWQHELTGIRQLEVSCIPSALEALAQWVCTPREWRRQTARQTVKTAFGLARKINVESFDSSESPIFCQSS